MHLPIILLGYFFNVLSILGDKFIVEKAVSAPLTYTFYVGALGLVTFFLIPFGFSLPPQTAIFYSLGSGLAYLLGLFTLYTALADDEASIITPMVGIFNSIFTLLVGFFVFSQIISNQQLLAVIILTVGLLILPSHSFIQTKVERKDLFLVITSGLLFALSAVLVREAFLRTSFINGLVLTYGSSGAMSLLLLFYPPLLKSFSKPHPKNQLSFKKTFFVILAAQIAGGLSGFLITYSYSLTSPAIVNALRGLQYVALFLIIMILPKKFREIFHEEISKQAIVHKSIGSVIILIGLAVLAL